MEPKGVNKSARAALANLLRECAVYLEQAADADVEAIVHGEMDLRISICGRRTSGRRVKPAVLSTEQIDEIVQSLKALQSRTDGENLLKQRAATRKSLEAVARHIDVSVRKSERVEDLRQRIVEGTIGFRLSSAAIRGRSASSSGPASKSH